MWQPYLFAAGRDDVCAFRRGLTYDTLLCSLETVENITLQWTRPRCREQNGLPDDEFHGRTHAYSATSETTDVTYR